MRTQRPQELTGGWLRGFAEDITRRLHGWAATPSRSGGVLLAGHDGAKLQVQQARSPQPRVRFEGAYPHSPYHFQPGESEPSITVAATRPPRDVANDITRRLLPTYLHVLDKVRRALAETAEKDARRDAVAHRLAGLVPGACVRVAGDPGVGEHETLVRWPNQHNGLGSGWIRLSDAAETAVVHIDWVDTAVLDQLLSGIGVPAPPAPPTRTDQDIATG